MGKDKSNLDVVGDALKRGCEPAEWAAYEKLREQEGK